MKPKISLIKSSSTSVKFSIKKLMEEVKSAVAEKKIVLISSCINLDSTYQKLQTNRIMTPNTKSFFLPLQLSGIITIFLIEPWMKKLSYIFWEKIELQHEKNSIVFFWLSFTVGYDKCRLKHFRRIFLTPELLQQRKNWIHKNWIKYQFFTFFMIFQTDL